MRKIIVLSFISLDGVMQAPGGPGEDPSGNFTLEGWAAGYWDDFYPVRWINRSDTRLTSFLEEKLMIFSPITGQNF